MLCFACFAQNPYANVRYIKLVHFITVTVFLLYAFLRRVSLEQLQIRAVFT